MFSDVDTFTEERIDELLSVFLKDFKEDSLETKGWPALLSAYVLSKAAMNAHTRILAKKYPNFCINCICPGFVKTDMSNNTGTLSVDEAAEYPVKLALLPDGGPSGLFFILDKLSCFWMQNNPTMILDKLTLLNGKWIEQQPVLCIFLSARLM